MMRIEAARRIFPRCWFDEKKTEAGRDALGYFHERKDENRNVGLGPEMPSIVRDCSVSESPDNRVFNHKCLTNFGYSGAPILAQIGGITAVIGINSVGNF